jgi:hypothetical protein
MASGPSSCEGDREANSCVISVFTERRDERSVELDAFGERIEFHSSVSLGGDWRCVGLGEALAMIAGVWVVTAGRAC